MAMIELAGVSLELWEDGEGRNLLFLHGAGGFRADHPFLALLGRHRRGRRAIPSRLWPVVIA